MILVIHKFWKQCKNSFANCQSALQIANCKWLILNIVFLFQMTILRWVTFLLGSLTVTNTILLFWISFFLSFGNSDHLVSVSIDFPSNSELDHPFHFIAFGYSLADWNDLCDRLRDIQLIIWYDLNSVLLLLQVNFVSAFRLE